MYHVSCIIYDDISYIILPYIISSYSLLFYSILFFYFISSFLFYVMSLCHVRLYDIVRVLSIEREIHKSNAQTDKQDMLS